MGNYVSSASKGLPPLKPAPHCNIDKFMGSWFVIGNKPTMVEKTVSNSVETYSRAPGGSGHDIDIAFYYNKDEPIKSKLSSLPQKGYIQGEDKNDSTEWKVSPMWPIKLPYLILEVADDYSWTVVGYPSRDYAWIMSRHPTMPDDIYEMLKTRLVEKHQYDLEGLRRVPQVWTKEERKNRGFTEIEIPDSMLTASVE
jgi:apolipoprotein D and lipocalin family protein